MNWDSIVQAINNFFNQPVPIIGCTIGALLVSVLIIISKTSLGKKSLNYLNKSMSELNKNCEEKLTALEQEKQEIIEKSKETIQAMEDYYKAKVAEFELKKDESIELLLLVCNEIHNKNVQEYVKQYKEKLEKPIVIDEVINDKVAKEYQSIREEFEQQKAELNAILEELKNERKEDTNTTQETL